MKERQPLALPSAGSSWSAARVWWLVVGLLVAAGCAAAAVSGQHAAHPCRFNSMCTCKMAAVYDNHNQAGGALVGDDQHDPPSDVDRRHQQIEDSAEAAEAEDDEDEEDVGDVSCVAVPFAVLPGKSMANYFVRSIQRSNV